MGFVKEFTYGYMLIIHVFEMEFTITNGAMMNGKG
jgi:hypothetical protein